MWLRGITVLLIKKLSLSIVHMWESRRWWKTCSALTRLVLHHQEGCYACTEAGSFSETDLWEDAEHLDTSPPDPSKCPCATEGMSAHTLHPLLSTSTWKEKEKRKEDVMKETLMWDLMPATQVDRQTKRLKDTQCKRARYLYKTWNDKSFKSTESGKGFNEPSSVHTFASRFETTH